MWYGLAWICQKASRECEVVEVQGHPLYTLKLTCFTFTRFADTATSHIPKLAEQHFFLRPLNLARG
jgi:hypothetical protein